MNCAVFTGIHTLLESVCHIIIERDHVVKASPHIGRESAVGKGGGRAVPPSSIVGNAEFLLYMKGAWSGGGGHFTFSTISRSKGPNSVTTHTGCV